MNNNDFLKETDIKYAECCNYIYSCYTYKYETEIKCKECQIILNLYYLFNMYKISR